MPTSGSSYGGLKFPGGPKKRKAAKAAPSPMDGFAFPKPVREKPTLRPGQNRRTRINPRRIKARRGPWRSKEHKARVRELPCCAPGAPRGCRGRKTASHLDQGLKEKGMGMKTGDQNCVPHCNEHNACWDGHRGPFAGWTDEEREVYADEAIHETQVLLGLRQAA
jgi:hypothetical protein